MPFLSRVTDNFGLVFNTSKESDVFAIGGTVTTSGGYRIHTFTSSGELSFLNVDALTPVEYLVVAGGGGGGGGNLANPADPAAKNTGGGAGGLLTGTFLPDIRNYTITVGAGGAAGTATVSSRGGNGGDSSISTIVSSVGGGGGGSIDYNKSGNTGSSGLNGGSGGGGGGDSTVAFGAGTGIPGQGFNGSSAGGTKVGGVIVGAGGGAGGAASFEVGGPGITTDISGTLTTYAKGGDASGFTGLQPNNTGNGGIKLSPGADGIVIVRYKYP